MDPAWSGFPLWSARHLRLLCQCLGTPIDQAHAQHLSRHILATATIAPSSSSSSSTTATATATQTFQLYWFTHLATACTDLPAAHFLLDLLSTLDHLTDELHALRSFIAEPQPLPQPQPQPQPQPPQPHHHQAALDTGHRSAWTSNPSSTSGYAPIATHAHSPATSAATATIPATSASETLDRSQQLLTALFSASQASQSTHADDFSARFLPPSLPQGFVASSPLVPRGTVLQSTVSVAPDSAVPSVHPAAAQIQTQSTTDGSIPRIPRRNVHQLLPPNS